MNRPRWTTFVAAAAAVAGLCTLAGGSAMPAPTHLDTVTAPPAQAAPTAVAPGTYTGKVTRNTNAGLTIHSDDGDRTVVVQPGAAISRNGKTVGVSDLKTDDQVTMTVAQNGVVQSINATSKKSSGFNPLWLLLLLLLLIPLLLWLLSRRKKNDFVVERNTGASARSAGNDFTIEKNQGSRGTPPRA